MTRTPLAALALVAALACAGCNDDDPRPDFAPPESTSPAPTTPPTTSEPPEPERLSPEETVRAWVEARNLGLKTGRLTQVRELSAPNCTSCNDLIDPIEDVYEAGGEFRTRGWSIAGLNVKKADSRRAEIQVALDVAGGQTIQEAGGEPVSYPPENGIAIFELASNDDERWAVSLLGFLS